MQPLGKIVYKEIHKIIEAWQTEDQKQAITPEVINEKFELWAGVSFEVFKEKLHSKYIQRKIIGTHIQPDLFSGAPLENPFPKLNVTLKKWELEDDDHLAISYSFENSLFGEILVASTVKGICWLAFVTERGKSLQELKAHFLNTVSEENSNTSHKKVIKQLFDVGYSQAQVYIHLKGTTFQYKVWKALLEIPLGELVSYGDIARKIGITISASRAVGTAIGSNVMAVIIPCHRVVRSSGIIGDFRWGSPRKMALIGWEALRLDNASSI